MAEHRPGGSISVSSRFGLLGAAILLTLTYTLGATLPLGLDGDWFFGAEAYRSLGLGALVPSAALLLALLAWPGALDRVAAMMGRATERVSGSVGIVAVIVALGAAFLVLTTYKLSGDAKSILYLVAARSPYPSNALASYLQIGTMDALGVGARDAIRFVAAAAGVVYAIAAIRIGRECFSDRGRRAGLAGLLLTAGSAALFFGSIEVYAPLVAGVAVYLLCGIRHMNGVSTRPWPAFALGVTFCLHGAAGLLLPSLALLANDGKLRPLRWKRLFLWGGTFLVPVAVVFGVLVVGFWGGDPPEGQTDRIGNFLGAAGQSALLPLTRTTENLGYRYALLDLEHILGVLNLYLVAAPVGFFLLFLAWRPRRVDPLIRWLLVAAVFLAAYPVVWNVSYPLRRDWDLFSFLGIPVTLLAGIVFLRRDSAGGTALGSVLLGLFCVAPVVIGGTGAGAQKRNYAYMVASVYRTLEAGVEGAESQRLGELATRWETVRDSFDAVSLNERYAQATRHAAAGRYGVAAERYREILHLDPENPKILTNLGSVLFADGRLDEAREILERSAAANPEDLFAWLNLAGIAEKEGKPEEAVRRLQRGLRGGLSHPRAGETLAFLAKLKAAQGAMDEAKILGRMARERGFVSGPSMER